MRRAEATDVAWLMIQLREFSKFIETKYELYGSDEYTEDGIKILIEKHFLTIATLEEKPVGFIAGYFNPHLFNPAILVLCELFWWVVPEHRNSRVGAMLMNEFIDFGKKNAQWISCSLNRFTEVNQKSLLKRGFHEHERTFLLEV
jgi:RimJ/RimL family protein N-acetyltransferase